MTYEDRLRELAEERRGWADASPRSVAPRHKWDAAACLAGAEALRLLREYRGAVDIWESAGMLTWGEAYVRMIAARDALLATEVTR